MSDERPKHLVLLASDEMPSRRTWDYIIAILRAGHRVELSLLDGKLRGQEAMRVWLDEMADIDDASA